MNKKLDPIESTRALDMETRAEWQKRYEPKALQQFMKPAEVCTLCGGEMHINPETGEEQVISKRERKWSIHEYCFVLAEDRLDRSESMGTRRS